MKIKLQQNKKSGSTLPEVLAAVTVLAICAVGLMGAMANGFRTIQFARENQRATQILMEETEMIRLYTWDQVNTPGFIPSTFTAAYDPQSTGGGGLYYNVTVSITDPPFSTSYSSNIKQLTVTLDWTSKKISRSRTITTLVSKDGLQNYVF